MAIGFCPSASCRKKPRCNSALHLSEQSAHAASSLLCDADLQAFGVEPETAATLRTQSTALTQHDEVRMSFVGVYVAPALAVSLKAGQQLDQGGSQVLQHRFAEPQWRVRLCHHTCSEHSLLTALAVSLEAGQQLDQGGSQVLQRRFAEPQWRVCLCHHTCSKHSLLTALTVSLKAGQQLDQGGSQDLQRQLAKPQWQGRMCYDTCRERRLRAHNKPHTQMQCAHSEPQGPAFHCDKQARSTLCVNDTLLVLPVWEYTQPCGRPCLTFVTCTLQVTDIFNMSITS